MSTKYVFDINIFKYIEFHRFISFKFIVLIYNSYFVYLIVIDNYLISENKQPQKNLNSKSSLKLTYFMINE